MSADRNAKLVVVPDPFEPSPITTPFAEDERPVSSWPANHSRRGVAVGGTLWLTDRRLLFIPNRLEAVVGRQGWERELGDVREVTVSGRGLTPASWRRRLALRSARGLDHFLVPDVGDVAAQLSDAVVRS